jgi:hypothetical protein
MKIYYIIIIITKYSKIIQLVGIATVNITINDPNS